MDKWMDNGWVWAKNAACHVSQQRMLQHQPLQPVGHPKETQDEKTQDTGP